MCGVISRNQTVTTNISTNSNTNISIICYICIIYINMYENVALARATKGFLGLFRIRNLDPKKSEQFHGILRAPFGPILGGPWHVGGAI